jgi:hypothetical protein
MKHSEPRSRSNLDYKSGYRYILASISVSEANVKSAGGNIETKIRLDKWLAMTT